MAWNLETLPASAIPLRDTFEGFLGLQWIEVTSTSARVSFEVRENLKLPRGLLQGGIYSAVAETVASVATIRGVWRDGLIGCGLSNSASFLRPITEGSVHVTSRLRHQDEREWFWSHDFLDEQERLCALVEVIIAVQRAAQRRS